MKLSEKQVELLQAIRDLTGAAFHKITCEALERGGLIEWRDFSDMRLVGCNSFSAARWRMTEAGSEALRQAELGRLGKAAMRQLSKLRSGKKILCRAVRPEASGYDYFTEPDHRPFPELSARYLIENGYVTPQDDGLFAGFSQTFVVPRNA